MWSGEKHYLRGLISCFNRKKELLLATHKISGHPRQKAEGSLCSHYACPVCVLSWTHNFSFLSPQLKPAAPTPWTQPENCWSLFGSQGLTLHSTQTLGREILGCWERSHSLKSEVLRIFPRCLPGWFIKANSLPLQRKMKKTYSEQRHDSHP